MIVIDAPALGKQVDAAAIAAHADFTVLVIADGAASAGIVRNAKVALSRLGNTRLGLVINKMDPGMANPAAPIGRDWHSEKSASLA